MKDVNFLETTVDQWRAELNKFTPHKTGIYSFPELKDGLTLAELQAKLGVSYYRIRLMVHGLIESGDCIRGRGLRETISGVLRPEPVYKLIDKNKKDTQ